MIIFQNGEVEVERLLLWRNNGDKRRVGGQHMDLGSDRPVLPAVGASLGISLGFFQLLSHFFLFPPSSTIPGLWV